ncbi:hypothetical protein [Actinospongicola halichondriae]|uniref:hypothetical protein n=1 Tax=Actinospongicola halichondriae TaxID=3236844 RepID=UPI003D551234
MDVDAPPAPTEAATGGYGSLGVAIGALVVAFCSVLASFPLKDNSFLTHLATGRIILESGSVPSSDPYTFTAQGVDWTVQSWLASVAYAGAEQLGGGAGLRILVFVVFGFAGALLWRLSRPAESIVMRILIVAGALLVVGDVWSERPYMIGVIGLAVVWLALDGAVRPWLLVPLMWVWANTHGSFLLALGLIVTVLAGTALDQRGDVVTDEGASRFRLDAELGVLKATVVGTLLAVIGPLGPRVLLFPLKAVTQSETLGDIVEWKAPAFTSIPQRAFLLLVIAVIAGLTRTGRWRLALPAIVFIAAGLVAQRNMVMAIMILVPVLAACAPEVGTLTSRSRPRIGWALTTVSGALVALVVVSSMSEPVTTLEPYPERAVAWVSAADPEHRAGNLASPDYVGNLFEALDGPTGRVFVDDRADMFPVDFFLDSRALAKGEPRWSAVLDEQDIGVLVWSRSSVLTSLVAEDDGWRVVFADTDSIVACRRGPACEALLS